MKLNAEAISTAHGRPYLEPPKKRRKWRLRNKRRTAQVLMVVGVFGFFFHTLLFGKWNFG